MTSPRSIERAVDPLFVERWSPRAFDGSAMPQDDLDTLFEAARWAPSAFNYQPWRFLYAHQGTETFDQFVGLLLPFNQIWAKHASVLLFVLSDTMMDAGKGPQPSSTNSFDAGAAWAILALQATRLGYHSHGMAGFDQAATREALDIPDSFRIEAAVAIGRIADKAILPEALQAREVPSDRKPLGEFAFKGAFPQQG